MLRVNCPWCGQREEVEFTCHGEASILRPNNAGELDDRGWGEYVFFKENAKGIVLERWEHSAGCRRWFVALRDNVADNFLGFAKADEPPPRVSAGYVQVKSCASVPLPNSASGYGKADKREIKHPVK